MAYSATYSVSEKTVKVNATHLLPYIWWRTIRYSLSNW